MALVNIPRDIIDAFYAYKMPALVVELEGRGNGIKTVIVNMADIAKSLDRPASYTTKFVGIELGALTKFYHEKDRCIVNGKHSQETLAEVLDKFIKRFVLCKKCANPETKMVLRFGQITLHCNACGNRSQVDKRHKLASYILQHPYELPNGAAGASKRDRKKGSKEDDGDEYTSKETDAEICSSQMLDETSELAAKLLLTNKPGEDKADPIETLRNFSKENPANKKLAAEIRRVKAEENWTDEQVSQVAFYLLFDENIVEQLKISAKIDILKEFVSNDQAQAGVLNGVLLLIGKDEALCKAAPHILKGLYGEDILGGETLIKWHDKKSNPDTAKIKEASTMFIDWLKRRKEMMRRRKKSC